MPSCPGLDGPSEKEYMTATIDLNEQEIEELKEFTHESDITSAVRIAMLEYIRYVRRLRLKELSGRVQMQENWMELEKAELEAGRSDSGTGSD